MSRWGDTAGRAGRAATTAARTAVSRSVLPYWVAAGTAVVLLVAAVVAGGLGRSRPAPTELGPGEEARLSQYTVTVLDAELTNAVEEEFLEADDGETIAVFTLRMENLSDAPVGVGQTVDRLASRLVNVSEPLLTLSDVTPTRSASVFRGDGSAGGVVLQPGVPSEVRIAWPVPEDSFADGTATLDLYDVRVTTGQIILSADHVTWRRAGLAARIDVEVGS